MSIFFSAPVLATETGEPPFVENGELNARDWPFFEGKALEIKGEWEVVWGRIVPPEEFDSAYKGEYFNLPGRWNGVKHPGIEGAYGSATFRVRLDLSQYNRDLTFHLIAPHAAYNIYIDDVLVIKNGTVTETAKGFEANYVSRTFKGQSGTSEIVLQVANFKHAYGGPGHALKLWDAQRLSQFLDILSVTYGLVLGIMFTIGLFHFILFLADRRRSYSAIHLWLSILCFIIVYRVQGVIPLFHDYYPDTRYWSNLRFTYSSLYAAPAVYLLFFRSVFPDQFPKKLTQALIGICLVGLLFTLIATEYYYTLTRNFSISLNVFAIIYSIVFTFKALWDKQAGAGVILITNFIFLLTALNDAMIYTDHSSGFDMTPFGILVLGLGYSYALLLRLQFTFKKARETSEALETLNKDLEKQVNERTRAFKAATAKAENSAREQAKFIAAASHDLRQPLHALSMFNAALKNKLGQKDETTLVEKQESAIANLSTLLQDTLDTARAEIQQKRPDHKPIKVDHLFSKLSEAFDIRASSQNLKLTFTNETGVIVSDNAMLQRILSNLVDNAIKAAKTTVSVSAKHEGSHWHFRISDDGDGIANDDIESIFDSYVSLGADPPDQMGGYGLGLYVVREFTKLLKGKINVSSVVKVGSSFELILPNQTLREETQNLLPDNTIDVCAFKGIRLLIIDDDTQILEAMEAITKTWKCQVNTVTNLAAAQQLIRKGLRPDLLLVDFHIHNIEGLDVITTLNREAEKPIPAIIITGTTEPHIIDKIKRTNIPILEKPVSPAELAKMITLVLERLDQA